MSSKTRLSTPFAAGLLVLAACAAAPSSTLRTVAVDEAFQLGLEEAVAVAGRPLRLGLADVMSDSRCPKGEQCVMAGEVRVQVWLQQGSSPRQTLELVQRPGRPGAPAPWPEAGVEIRLIDVQPGPVSGRTPARGDYRATLQLQEARSVSTAR